MVAEIGVSGLPGVVETWDVDAGLKEYTHKSQIRNMLRLRQNGRSGGVRDTERTLLELMARSMKLLVDTRATWRNCCKDGMMAETVLMITLKEEDYDVSTERWMSYNEREINSNKMI